MDLLQTFVPYNHVPVCQAVQGKCGMSYKSELAVFQLNVSPFSIEYTWTDAQSKKMKLPASQYVDFMATSIQNTLNDETLFPTKAGKGFFA
jgi:Mob1/phocein family